MIGDVAPKGGLGRVVQSHGKEDRAGAPLAGPSHDPRGSRFEGLQPGEVVADALGEQGQGAPVQEQVLAGLEGRLVARHVAPLVLAPVDGKRLDQAEPGRHHRVPEEGRLGQKPRGPTRHARRAGAGPGGRSRGFPRGRARPCGGTRSAPTTSILRKKMCRTSAKNRRIPSSLVMLAFSQTSIPQAKGLCVARLLTGERARGELPACRATRCLPSPLTK